MAELKTSVTVTAEDRFSGTAKKIAQSGGKLGKYFEKLSRRAGRIDQYGKLTAAIGKTGSELSRAREHTAKLGRGLAAMERPTKKLQSEFERARRISDRLGEQHREQRGKLRTLRDELRGAGIDTRKLGDAQRQLAADLERTSRRIERIGLAQDRVDRAGRFAVGASLVGGEISRVGASMRRVAAAPLEEAAEVGRQRGRLATLSMSVAGIDEVERVGRDIGSRLAGVNLAGFVGAAYDVRSAMSALSEVDVARVTGVAAVLARAADASTEEMTSAISGAYGVFKGPLFKQLSDIEFVGKYTAQLSQSVEQFRTTGSRMEQGIKTMGAGLSLSGIQMSEQLAALGQLQTQMDPSEAGTALRSFRQGAVDAQKAFAKAGRDVRIIDRATGGLRPIAAILDDMERVFGSEIEYDREKVFAEIKKAFGREEAARVIEGLWAGGKSLRDAADKLEDATMADVRRRARARDENVGGTLDRIQQRWENFQSRIDFEPWLARIEWGFNKLMDIAEAIETRWPGITSLVVGGLGAIGLAAGALSPIVISAGAAAWGLRQVHLWLLRIGALGGGMPGGPGGGKGTPATKTPKGPGGRIKNIGKFLGKRWFPIAASLSALGTVSTLLSDQSAAEKTRSIAGTAGGLGGAFAGAKLGALAGGALGTVVPVIGNVAGAAIGGLLGGGLGYFGGEWLGDQGGGLIADQFDDGSGLVEALAAAGGGSTTMNTDNSTHISQLTIHQQPGEDPRAMAERFLREVESRREWDAADALNDD